MTTSSDINETIKKRSHDARVKAEKYRKKHAKWLKHHKPRKLTPDEKRAVAKKIGAGFYKKIAKMREALDLPETSEGILKHPAAYVSNILEWSNDTTDPRDFVKTFLGKDPSYTGTNTGLAALQFEAWMVENAKELFAKFLETEVTPDEPTFLATFEGTLTPEDYTKMGEETNGYLTYETLVAAGTVDTESGKVVDFTILEMAPKKGVKLKKPPTTTIDPKADEKPANQRKNIPESRSEDKDHKDSYSTGPLTQEQMVAQGFQESDAYLEGDHVLWQNRSNGDVYTLQGNRWYPEGTLVESEEENAPGSDMSERGRWAFVESEPGIVAVTLLDPSTKDSVTWEIEADINGIRATVETIQSKVPEGERDDAVAAFLIDYGINAAEAAVIETHLDGVHNVTEVKSSDTVSMPVVEAAHDWAHYEDMSAVCEALHEACFVTAIDEDESDEKKKIGLAQAHTIRDQIGHKARFMLGAKHETVDHGEPYTIGGHTSEKKKPNHSMRIGKNSKGVNHIKTELNPDDTYDVTFGAIRGTTYKVKHKAEGVHAENLHKTIEAHTNMRTSLGSLGKHHESVDTVSIGSTTEAMHYPVIGRGAKGTTMHDPTLGQGKKTKGDMERTIDNALTPHVGPDKVPTYPHGKPHFAGYIKAKDHHEAMGKLRAKQFDKVHHDEHGFAKPTTEAAFAESTTEGADPVKREKKPYTFSFHPGTEKDAKRIVWQRHGTGTTSVHELGKKAALADYPKAHSFSTTDPQNESAPPGWEGTVKAMKKHSKISNPFALAWSMKKKGMKPHVKAEEATTEDLDETYSEAIKEAEALRDRSKAAVSLSEKAGDEDAVHFAKEAATVAAKDHHEEAAMYHIKATLRHLTEATTLGASTPEGILHMTASNEHAALSKLHNDLDDGVTEATRTDLWLAAKESKNKPWKVISEGPLGLDALQAEVAKYKDDEYGYYATVSGATKDEANRNARRGNFTDPFGAEEDTEQRTNVVAEAVIGAETMSKLTTATVYLSEHGNDYVVSLPGDQPSDAEVVAMYRGGRIVEKLGDGSRFKALEKKLGSRSSIKNPAALAAAIGRKKYGKKKMASMAHHESDDADYGIEDLTDETTMSSQVSGFTKTGDQTGTNVLPDPISPMGKTAVASVKAPKPAKQVSAGQPDKADGSQKSVEKEDESFEVEDLSAPVMEADAIVKMYTKNASAHARSAGYHGTLADYHKEKGNKGPEDSHRFTAEHAKEKFKHVTVDAPKYMKPKWTEHEKHPEYKKGVAMAKDRIKDGGADADAKDRVYQESLEEGAKGKVTMPKPGSLAHHSMMRGYYGTTHDALKSIGSPKAAEHKEKLDQHEAAVEHIRKDPMHADHAKANKDDQSYSIKWFHRGAGAANHKIAAIQSASSALHKGEATEAEIATLDESVTEAEAGIDEAAHHNASFHAHCATEGGKPDGTPDYRGPDKKKHAAAELSAHHAMQAAVQDKHEKAAGHHEKAAEIHREIAGDIEGDPNAKTWQNDAAKYHDKAAKLHRTEHAKSIGESTTEDLVEDAAGDDLIVATIGEDDFAKTIEQSADPERIKRMHRFVSKMSEHKTSSVASHYKGLLGKVVKQAKKHNVKLPLSHEDVEGTFDAIVEAKNVAALKGKKPKKEGTDEDDDTLSFDLEDVQTYYDMQIVRSVEEADAIVKVMEKFGPYGLTAIEVSPTGIVSSDDFPEADEATTSADDWNFAGDTPGTETPSVSTPGSPATAGTGSPGTTATAGDDEPDDKETEEPKGGTGNIHINIGKDGGKKASKVRGAKKPTTEAAGKLADRFLKMIKETDRENVFMVDVSNATEAEAKAFVKALVEKMKDKATVKQRKMESGVTAKQAYRKKAPYAADDISADHSNGFKFMFGPGEGFQRNADGTPLIEAKLNDKDFREFFVSGKSIVIDDVWWTIKNRDLDKDTCDLVVSDYAIKDGHKPGKKSVKYSSIMANINSGKWGGSTPAKGHMGKKQDKQVRAALRKKHGKRAPPGTATEESVMITETYVMVNKKAPTVYNEKPVSRDVLDKEAKRHGGMFHAEMAHASKPGEVHYGYKFKDQEHADRFHNSLNSHVLQDADRHAVHADPKKKSSIQAMQPKGAAPAKPAPKPVKK